MSRPWSLVTPASRGIGLALSRHLLRTTHCPVVATARSSDLDGVREKIVRDLDSRVDPSRLTVLQLDVLGRFRGYTSRRELSLDCFFASSFLSF